MAPNSTAPRGQRSYLCCGGHVWCSHAWWSVDSSCWHDYQHHLGLAHCPRPPGQLGCWWPPQPHLRTSLSGEGRGVSWGQGRRPWEAVRMWRDTHLGDHASPGLVALTVCGPLLLLLQHALPAGAILQCELPQCVAESRDTHFPSRLCCIPQVQQEGVEPRQVG